jgi:hypothetical protein
MAINTHKLNEKVHNDVLRFHKSLKTGFYSFKPFCGTTIFAAINFEKTYHESLSKHIDYAYDVRTEIVGYNKKGEIIFNTGHNNSRALQYCPAPIYEHMFDGLSYMTLWVEVRENRARRNRFYPVKNIYEIFPDIVKMMREGL